MRHRRRALRALPGKGRHRGVPHGAKGLASESLRAQGCSPDVRLDRLIVTSIRARASPYNRLMSRRTQRLNHLFREELAELIRTELSDPRLGEIVSITRVDVSPDLENASVFVSVLGDSETKTATMQALTHAAPFLRRHLLERMRIRQDPAPALPARRDHRGGGARPRPDAAGVRGEASRVTGASRRRHGR